MGKLLNRIFSAAVKLMTFLTAVLLAFIIYFIVKESLPLFESVSLGEFLLGGKWRPISYTTASPSYGIFNIICSTLYVSAIAVILALISGVGCAIFLSCVAGEKARSLLYPFIDLLAGIPSVVYGFVGLVIIVRLFQRMGMASGESILASGILLSVMILPFMISSCSETMLKMKDRYMGPSNSLGVGRWYAISSIILPRSKKSILISMVLAIGRAMGETMAVMMVIGNAVVFPHLLGKGETIASLIALEMGTAENGSVHYHALFAMGLVLMILLLIINMVINLIKDRILKQEG